MSQDGARATVGFIRCMFGCVVVYRFSQLYVNCYHYHYHHCYCRVGPEQLLVLSFVHYFVVIVVLLLCLLLELLML